jgi:hypothetical protein
VLDGVPDVVAALPDSGVQRIVTLSGFGHEAHPSLAALRATGLDVVVLRVGVVLAPLDDPAAGRPAVPARTRVAPLHVDDLISAIVAADRLRDLHGYVEVDAVGAGVVTGAELDRLLGTRRGWSAGWRHVPAAPGRRSWSATAAPRSRRCSASGRCRSRTLCARSAHRLPAARLGPNAVPSRGGLRRG